jgi:hypothetical protein
MDFSDLKIGDEVGLTWFDGWHRHESIKTIEDETPKFFIIEGKKYRKSNGVGYGTDKELIPVGTVRDHLIAKRLANKKDRFKRYAETLCCKFSPEFMNELEALIEKHST